MTMTANIKWYQDVIYLRTPKNISIIKPAIKNTIASAASATTCPIDPKITANITNPIICDAAINIIE